MSEDELPQVTKHDLLARVRTGIEAERQEAHRRSAGGVHDVGRRDTDQTLISIANSLDRHVERLRWLSRPRSMLPDWLKKRFIFFRITALERITVRVYSLLFANSNDAFRQTADGLDQISQAFRYMADDSGDCPANKKETRL